MFSWEVAGLVTINLSAPAKIYHSLPSPIGPGPRNVRANPPPPEHTSAQRLLVTHRRGKHLGLKITLIVLTLRFPASDPGC